jgi:hypothetical protein
VVRVALLSSCAASLRPRVVTDGNTPDAERLKHAIHK